MVKGVLVIVLLLLGCSKPKNSWQGVYFPDGCLTCDSLYEYSPVFKSFNGCKEWANGKMVKSMDKSSCGKNCEFEGRTDMSKCDLVVRSWEIPILPDSPTLDSFKE